MAKERWQNEDVAMQNPFASLAGLKTSPAAAEPEKKAVVLGQPTKENETDDNEQARPMPMSTQQTPSKLPCPALSPQ